MIKLLQVDVFELAARYNSTFIPSLRRYNCCFLARVCACTQNIKASAHNAVWF